MGCAPILECGCGCGSESTIRVLAIGPPVQPNQSTRGRHFRSFEVKFTRTAAGPAGSNATSGSWRIQKVSEDTAGLTSTWKVSGDDVSMSTPTGESWQAKFGGGESPVKGIYANETVSVKKLGPREIEVTYMRDGKLYVVDKITVSTDGKKMTTVSDNKWLGRTSTYIDEKQ